MAIGKRVRQLREERRIGQAELARRAGFKRNTLYRIEAGRNEPRMETVEAIARALRVDPGELFEAPQAAAEEESLAPLAEAPHLSPDLVDAERGFDDAFDQLWLQVNELRAEWISTAQKLTGEVQSARQAGDNESLWRLWHDANSCAQRASEDFQRLLVGPMTRLTDAAWKLPERASYRRRLALAKYASLIRDDSRALQRPADLAELWLELTGELERVARRDETERREAAEVEAAKAYSNVEADFGLEAA